MNSEDISDTNQEVKGKVAKAVGMLIGKERTGTHGDASDVANDFQDRIRSALTPSSSAGFLRSVAVAVLGTVVLVAILRRAHRGVGRIGPTSRSGWRTASKFFTPGEEESVGGR